MDELQTKRFKARLPVYLPGLCSGKYTYAQAAASTGYSVRSLQRFKALYLEEGLAFLERPRAPRLKPPVNKTPAELQTKIIALYLDQYSDVNFAYFRDCLEEFHGISISKNTLYGILKAAGIKSPLARHMKKRREELHRPRMRRACFGDMLQIDGTPFAWFYKFGNEKRFCLMGSIDDATSKITGLYMCEFECLYGYLEILRQTCQSYGVPREIYSDRAAIFCVTPKKKKNLTQWEELAGVHEKRTQWQRVLEDLGVNQILAWSPEAKGRVERMWQTLQGQLPMWFYKNGIDSVEKANEALPRYIAQFNKKYGVDPREADSFFVPLLDGQNLDDILCAQFTRQTNSAGEFSFHSYKFTILECNRIACRSFLLCISERGLFAKIDGLFYPVKCLDAPLAGLGETMPQVVRDIVYRYMFAYAKEVSA